ncbi:MAG: hypothetical protein ACRDAO_00295 [Culicoidibacterales bacterium]
MANRQTRKKQQTRKRRNLIVMIVAILIILVVGGIGTVFLLNQMDNTTATVPTSSDPQVRTTLQKRMQQEVDSLVMTGDYKELEVLSMDAVAQIFTYQALMSDTQLHGMAYIQPEKVQEYLEFLKTTIYFYYSDLVNTYGESELPEVANVIIGEIYEDTYTDEATETEYTAYEVEVTWNYLNSKSTVDSNQQWANSATLTWIYDENQSQWYLVKIDSEHDEDILLVANSDGENTESTVFESE